ISGIEEAKKIEGVAEIFIQHKLGDIVKEPTNNIDKTGHIIIVADTLEQAEEVFRKAEELIVFKSDESFSITEKEINQNARNRFGKEICWVCKVCDGTDCASGVPGMGGVGRMLTFQDNINSLREYSILPVYIRENVSAETEFNFLGKTFKTPVMAAPMTGAITNMNGAMDEFNYSMTVLKGCSDSGSIAWLGDGASPEKYLTILDAVRKSDLPGILICKPRSDNALLQERFSEAEKSGVFAIGMDIDALNFKTMVLKNQPSISRGVEALSKIRRFTKLPFILKGIMSVEDAKLALESGADCIVVSNHGGRVLDDMPGTARVLPAIREAIGDAIPVLADGGIRSGMDVFKMIALGADGVLVGRPVAISAVGGEVAGVKFLLNQYTGDLRQTMNITGSANLGKIRKSMILKK
ncbi:MAG: alpha-hydroxy-acid oxidizing protein, partial [Leptospira sp.]|nr:alpha-hydroxy-acid oxidizing protein [Leptospira sp.]